MKTLILKRLIMIIPVLLAVTFLVFTIMEMTPGDPAIAKLGADATPELIEQVHIELGLDAVCSTYQGINA